MHLFSTSYNAHRLYLQILRVTPQTCTRNTRLSTRAASADIRQTMSSENEQENKLKQQ